MVVPECARAAAMRTPSAERSTTAAGTACNAATVRGHRRAVGMGTRTPVAATPRLAQPWARSAGTLWTAVEVWPSVAPALRARFVAVRARIVAERIAVLRRPAPLLELPAAPPQTGAVRLSAAASARCRIPAAAAVLQTSVGVRARLARARVQSAARCRTAAEARSTVASAQGRRRVGRADRTNAVALPPRARTSALIAARFRTAVAAN